MNAPTFDEGNTLEKIIGYAPFLTAIAMESKPFPYLVQKKSDENRIKRGRERNRMSTSFSQEQVS